MFALDSDLLEPVSSICVLASTSSYYLFRVICSAIVEADASHWTQSKDTNCMQDTMLPLLLVTLTASSPTAHIIAKEVQVSHALMTGFGPHRQGS